MYEMGIEPCAFIVTRNNCVVSLIPFGSYLVVGLNPKPEELAQVDSDSKIYSLVIYKPTIMT